MNLKSYIYRFIDWLNQPFPSNSNNIERFLEALITGLFVCLFLFVFKPFGLRNYPGTLILVCVGYGAVTTIILLLHEWITGRILKIKKDVPHWTVKRWIFGAMVNICLIAVGNYLFHQLIFGWSFSHWQVFLITLANTFLIGLFPVIFLALFIQIKAQQKYQHQAQLLQQQLSSFPSSSYSIGSSFKVPDQADQIQLSSINSQDQVKLSIDQIYYIEAMQNYVAVYFQKASGNTSLERKILRNTIRHISQQLHSTPIIRCHRSYLININHIEKIGGNAQGLRITLSHPKAPIIPVSRPYIPKIKSTIPL